MVQTRHSDSVIPVFLPALAGGGAERMLVHLANFLSHKGYPIDLILARATGPYLVDVEKNVNVIDLNVKFFLDSMYGLANYLHRSRPRILLSSLDKANFVAVTSKRITRARTKIITRVASTITPALQHSSWLKARTKTAMVKFTYSRSDKVLAISEGVSSDICELVGKQQEEIRVIYNPALPPKLQLLSQIPTQHPWLQHSRVPTILAVGRLAKQKDYPTLIKAFRFILDNRNARLVILGEGPERRQLENLVASFDLRQHVHMPGFIENPYPYMAGASVLVLSSAWEGFGNVLVEAMGLGTPVVATDCPSGPREILADGEYGMLAPVGDAQALSRAIINTLDAAPDPSVLKKAAQRFSLNLIAGKYLEVFRDLGLEVSA